MDKVFYKMAQPDEKTQEYPTSPTTQQEYFPAFSEEDIVSLEAREKEREDIRKQLSEIYVDEEIPEEELNREYLHKKIWEGLNNLKIQSGNNNDDILRKIADELDSQNDTDITSDIDTSMAMRAYYSAMGEDVPNTEDGESLQGKDIDPPYVDTESIGDDFLHFLRDNGLLYVRGSVGASLMNLEKPAIFLEDYDFESPSYQGYDFQEEDEVGYYVSNIRDKEITLTTNEGREFKVQTNYLIDTLLIFGATNPENIEGSIHWSGRVTKDFYVYNDELLERLEDKDFRKEFFDALASSNSKEDKIKEMLDEEKIPYEKHLKITDFFRDPNYSYEKDTLDVRYDYGYEFATHKGEERRIDFKALSDMGLDDTYADVEAYLKWYEFDEETDESAIDSIKKWKTPKKEIESSSINKTMIRYGQDEPIDYEQGNLPEMESGQILMPVVDPEQVRKMDEATNIQEAMQKYDQNPDSLTEREYILFIRGVLELNDISPEIGIHFIEHIADYSNDGEDLKDKYRKGLYEILFSNITDGISTIDTATPNGAGSTNAWASDNVNNNVISWLIEEGIVKQRFDIGEVDSTVKGSLSLDRYFEGSNPFNSGEVNYEADDTSWEANLLESYEFEFDYKGNPIKVTGDFLVDKIRIKDYIEPYNFESSVYTDTYIIPEEVKNYLDDNEKKEYFFRLMNDALTERSSKIKFLQDIGLDYKSDISIDIHNIGHDQEEDGFIIDLTMEAPYDTESPTNLIIPFKYFDELGIVDTEKNLKLMLKYYFLTGIIPGELGTKLGWEDFLKEEGITTLAALPLKKRWKRVSDEDTIRENELSQSQENLETEKTNDEFRKVDTH